MYTFEQYYKESCLGNLDIFTIKMYTLSVKHGQKVFISLQ